MAGAADEDGKAGRARRLMAVLSSYLRTRARGLAADHDDLIQQTLTDLYRLEQLPGRTQHRDEDGTRRAIAILRRRIADRYRERSRDVVIRHAAEEISFTVDDDIAGVLAQRRLLRRALAFIAGLEDRDRRLLLSRMNEARTDRAQTSAERKQLSRLRARLRAEFADEFRPSAEPEREE